MKAALFFSLMILGAGFEACAFPDLIRHHYVNCTACHVAPTGGGLLNPYGRSMSREVLSASGGEREVEFLHGILPEESMPEWLLPGGDIRVLQVHTESPDRKAGRTIFMQGGFEFGVVKGPVTGVIFLGQAVPEPRDVRWVAPRYYLLVNATEQLSVRGGRFVPAFGLNIPYHTLPTRQGLGFGANQERDAAEIVWSGEQWNWAVSGSRSAPNVPVALRENLATLQVNRTFLDSHRVGFSVLKGSSKSLERDAAGVQGVFGFTEKIAYLTEFDYFWNHPVAGGATTGLSHFSQLIWEVRKGWQPYLMETYMKSNLSDSSTLMDSRGVGLRYYPRPHFEIDLAWFKQRVAIVADRYDDMAWVLAHYYF